MIGVPDQVRDKAVKAFVRLQPGAELSTEQIIEHCRSQLARSGAQYVELVRGLPSHRVVEDRKRLLQH